MITFCINTARNELNHIKLLLKSLDKNLSTKDHEILVFVDSDNQNTFEWLLEQKFVFPNLKVLRNTLPICYGYARNINEMFLQASNDIVSYLQSDMVICKDYDIEILKHLEPGMILCSTRVEPPLHGNSGEKYTYDFGLEPTTFDLDAFTKYADTKKVDRLTEYFFAPFTMYKDVWNSIGGHDTLFRRSREDSDILTRLVLNDTKIKQTWSAIVYHFTCTSSRGSKWFDNKDSEAQQRVQLQQQADNIEFNRFIRRWGKFNHSTEKAKYYGIVAKITGQDINIPTITAIQSYFDKVYVEDVKVIPTLQEWYDREHDVANKLLNISVENWNEYRYMYNQEKVADRVKPLLECKGDVIVEFAFKDITPQLFNDFIIQLQDIVDTTYDVGEFEYGPFKITINSKKDIASERIHIKNPEVKADHKYTIH
jgi:glycosyltransferase involved in cell wall biosynthesis